MTVEELREALKEYSPSTKIVLNLFWRDKNTEYHVKTPYFKIDYDLVHDDLYLWNKDCDHDSHTRII